jgi:hypothetical protein
MGYLKKINLLVGKKKGKFVGFSGYKKAQKTSASSSSK